MLLAYRLPARRTTTRSGAPPPASPVAALSLLSRRPGTVPARRRATGHTCGCSPPGPGLSARLPRGSWPPTGGRRRFGRDAFRSGTRLRRRLSERSPRLPATLDHFAEPAAALGPLPEHPRLSLDAGYDYGMVHHDPEARGIFGQIAERGAKTSIQAGGRWVEGGGAHEVLDEQLRQAPPLYRATKSPTRVLHRPGQHHHHRPLPAPTRLDPLPLGHPPTKPSPSMTCRRTPKSALSRGARHGLINCVREAGGRRQLPTDLDQFLAPLPWLLNCLSY